MPELERDAQGKIVHSKLSSEEAAAMARARWSKPIAREAEDILEWLGFDEKTKPADPVSRRLSEEVARGGAGTSSNVRELLRHTGHDVGGNGDIAPAKPPKAGEACPTCGTIYTPLNDGTKLVSTLLEQFRKEHGKKDVPAGAVKITYPDNIVDADGNVIGLANECLLTDQEAQEYVDDMFKEREMPGSDAR
jgi:hypothetical protein